MVEKVVDSVSAIVEQALGQAGVPAANIELAPETGGEAKTPNIYGPKGDVKGAGLVEEESSETGAEGLPKPASDEPTEQPLSKEAIKDAIDQASSKFQGIMDRKINTLQTQMQQTIGALNQFFQSQEDSSLSGLPAEEQVQKRLERLEGGGTKQPRIQIDPAQPIEQEPIDFYQICADVLDTVGLGADDKRIDWAKEPGTTRKVGFNRFLVSVKKAVAADQTQAVKDLKDNGDKELQKIRKRTGVDKVSTKGPSGAGLPDVSKMTPMQKIDYGYKIQEQQSQTN